MTDKEIGDIKGNVMKTYTIALGFAQTILPSERLNDD